jgi:hypothetical protein
MKTFKGGPAPFKLAGGSEIYIQDIVDNEQYSTLEVHRGRVPQFAEVFDYARGMAVPSSPSQRRAGNDDTSFVRPPTSGLPQAWEGHVFGWRAAVEGPQADDVAVRAWLAATGATLTYRHKYYAVLPLSELVRVPTPVIDPEGKPGDWPGVLNLKPGEITLPIHLQENLEFGVRLYTEDTMVLAALADALTAPIKVRVFLRGWWKRPVV